MNDSEDQPMRRRHEDGNAAARKRHQYHVARAREWWVEFNAEDISAEARCHATALIRQMHREWGREKK